MLKRFKKAAILSSLAILLPIPAGLMLWDRLPDVMATHWGPGGQTDGWAGKGFVVFGLPLILLALHWLCLIITDRDPGHREQSRKPMALIFWFVPAISILCSAFVYAVPLGWKPEASWVVVLLALMFIVIGNYLPKCRRNHTLGIKVKWALENEENWNATHRFGGRVWVICGIASLPLVLLPSMAAFAGIMIVTLAACLIPTVYSWQYHKKQLREGTAAADGVDPMPKWAKGLAIGFVALILIFVSVLMFSGTIEYSFGEESFTVAPDWYADLTVEYADVQEAEYRQEGVPGVRVFGYSSARLLLGTFENEEFGTYARYTVNDGGPCVVLRSEDGVLVLSGADETHTLKIYKELTSRISPAG